MKPLVKTLMLFLFFTVSACLKAQTMEESLSKAYMQMDSIKGLSDMMSVSAQFDMIADKWNNEWIANYYACLLYTSPSPRD